VPSRAVASRFARIICPQEHDMGTVVEFSSGNLVLSFLKLCNREGVIDAIQAIV
jgi:hypothetical protein